MDSTEVIAFIIVFVPIFGPFLLPFIALDGWLIVRFFQKRVKCSHCKKRFKKNDATLRILGSGGGKSNYTVIFTCSHCGGTDQREITAKDYIRHGFTTVRATPDEILDKHFKLL